MWKVDSYPVQYLGYCTVCNSTNLNRWKHPMAPVKCQLINPRECEKKPYQAASHYFKNNLSDKNLKKKKKKNPSYFSSPPLLCCHGHGHRYPQFQLLSQTTFARPPSSLPWLFSFSSWWSELSSCKWFFSSHGFCESLFSFPKWFFSQDIPDITFWHKFFIISISLLYPRFFFFFFFFSPGLCNGRSN